MQKWSKLSETNNNLSEDELLTKISRYLDLYGKWIESDIEAEMDETKNIGIKDFIYLRLEDLFDELMLREEGYDA